MNTYKQLLNQLPFPYNKMAIEECKRQNHIVLQEVTGRDIASASHGSFEWDTSELGFHFWAAIHDECKYISERLDYLRKEIKAERISYGEILELRSLKKYIPSGDVLLLEWAGVKEKIAR